MVVGAVELFSLGVIKASIIGQNKLRSGLEFLTIGAVATNPNPQTPHFF
jgi:hypothetical protein